MMVVKQEVSKIELDSLQLSFHARHDRAGRMRKMKRYGIGRVIGTYLADSSGGTVYVSLTENGNIFIMNKDTKKLVTLWNMHCNKIKRIFFNDNMPDDLYNHIREYNKLIGTR